MKSGITLSFAALLVLTCQLSFAQDVPTSFAELLNQNREQRMQEGLRPGGRSITPTEFLLNAKLPAVGTSLSPGQCGPKRPSQKREKRTEVLLVLRGAEPALEPDRIRLVSEHNFAFRSKHLVDQLGPLPTPKTKGGAWPIEMLKQQALEIEKQKSEELGFNVGDSPGFRRSIYVESVIQWATHHSTSMSEAELEKQIAATFKQLAPSKEELRAIFSTLQDRLYMVYNRSLNPQQNKSGAESPKNIPLPNMFQAAASWDVKQGGVCTHISQSLYQIGRHLFPDEDMFVINNGSHFAVLSRDANNKTHVYNWSSHFEQSNPQGSIEISNALPATNTRVYKMSGEKMEEIAVLPTELGALIESVQSRARASRGPSMNPGVDPKVGFVQYSKTNGAQTKTLKLGTGMTSASKVAIVMAEIETDRAYLSGGAAFQQMTRGVQNKNVVVFVDFGRELPIIEYIAPGVEIKLVGGVRGQASYGFVTHVQNSDGGVTDVPAYSLNLSLAQRLTITGTKPDSWLQYRVEAGSTQNVGVNDLGKFQAGISQSGFQGVIKPITAMAPRFSQADVSLNLKKPLNRGVSLSSEFKHQATNLWKVTQADFGVSVETTDGTQAYVLGGYIWNRGGFESQRSFMNLPEGASIKAAIRRPSGAELKFQGTGLNTQFKQVGGGVILPIRKRRK